jgi:hypothetical protein
MFRCELLAVGSTRLKRANNPGGTVSGTTQPSADYTGRAVVCLISDSAIVELIS